jgi:hypothetical protein
MDSFRLMFVQYSAATRLPSRSEKTTALRGLPSGRSAWLVSWARGDLW